MFVVSHDGPVHCFLRRDTVEDIEGVIGFRVGAVRPGSDDLAWVAARRRL